MAQGIVAIGLARMEGLYSMPVEHGIEAASQSYKKGAPLIYSSGSIAIAGTNPTTVLGIACAPATGVTGTDVPYIPALQDSLIFEISVDGAIAVTNAPATKKPSDFTIGATYGITRDPATGNWFLDNSKSGGNQVMILVDYDTDQASLIQGRVHVRWLRTSATIYI